MKIVLVVTLIACGSGDPPPPSGAAKPATVELGSGSVRTDPVPKREPAIPPPGAGSARSIARVVPPDLGGAPKRVPTESGFRLVEGADFRHSSVRGDFRIYRTMAGIVVSWRTELSARSLDGKPLWRKADQGRAVAVSPDGTRIVSNNQAGQLVILDAKTGERIGSPVQLGGKGDTKRDGVWIMAFAWMPDGKHILAIDPKHVYRLDWTGAVLNELRIACKDECFFTAAIGLTSDEAILSNTLGSFGSQLLRIKIADGSTIAAADYCANNPDLGADGKHVVVDGVNDVAMFDVATLTRRWEVGRPGFAGVKRAAEATGYNQWVPLPKLSPDGRHVVVNDNAGRLWLLDATTGKPVLAYSTELVDFVEDVIWLDDGSLVAIDNAGSVMRIAGTPAKVVWTEPDMF